VVAHAFYYEAYASKRATGRHISLMLMLRAVPRHRQQRQHCGLATLRGAALAGRGCDARRLAIPAPSRPCYTGTRRVSASLCSAWTLSRTPGARSGSPHSHALALPLRGAGCALQVRRTNTDFLKESHVVLRLKMVVRCHSLGKHVAARPYEPMLTRCRSCTRDG
jgi:hypothetical protein